jgi:uncharacterized protein VirK/YbjX
LLSFIYKELSARREFGGELSFTSTCLRLLGVLARLDTHWRVVAAVRGAHTRSILAPYPRVVYRYTLPYLSSVFARGTRAQILQAHYGFLNTQLRAAFFQKVLNDSLALWRAHLAEHTYEVTMAGPCPDREGELTLRFKMDGITIYRLAFSIMPAAMVGSPTEAVPPAPGLVLYVGQVQGCKVGFELIRQATKTCLDVAPPDLLMAALFGVAQAWRISVIAGVASEHCLTIDKIKKLKAGFDLSAFWAKYRAPQNKQGHHVLTLPFTDKPLSEVKANHRGRTAAKRAFKLEVSQACAATLTPMVRSHQGSGPAAEA